MKNILLRFNNNSILQNILRRSFWLLVANIIGKLALFFSNVIAARIMEQNLFGQYTTIRSTIFLFENVISKSINVTSVKKIAEIKKNDESKLPSLILSLLIINLLLCLFAISFIYLKSDWIVNTFLMGFSNIKKALFIGFLLLIGSTFSALSQSILIGLERFKNIALINIITSIVTIPIIFYLISNFNLNGALIGVSFFFFIDFVFKLILIFKYTIQFEISTTLLQAMKQLRGIVFFSSPVLLSVVINGLVFWNARILLINEQKSFESIAIFDAAYQWLSIIMIVTASTTTVALPMLSKSFGYTDKMKQIFKYNLIINFLISVSIALVFITFSNVIMSLYGESYRDGGSILIILSVTSIFFTIATLYNRYMISINKPVTLVIASIISSIFLFFIYYFLGISIHSLALAILTYYIVSAIYYSCYKYYLDKTLLYEEIDSFKK